MEVIKISYDPNISCYKKECDSHDIELHHIVPKFMDGKDTDGRKYLCKKHHNILGSLIPSIIFKFLSEELKEKCRIKVKEYTLWWLKRE